MPITVGAPGSAKEAHGHLKVTEPDAGLHGAQHVFERVHPRRERLVVAGCVVERNSGGRADRSGLADWIGPLQGPAYRLS